MIQLLYGFLASLVIVSLAYHMHSLDRSGALAASMIGTIIFGLGGWQWAVILLTFFISSSLLSLAFGKRKSSLLEKFEKGSRRDAGQVLANGSVAALFACLSFFFPTASWPWVGFISSLAAVNADTWATELGVLNPTPPRLITTGRMVEKGTSGGISMVGTLAAAGGAGLVAVIACLVGPDAGFPWLFILVILAGLLGAMFDSLLGATSQAIYICPDCKKETESHPLHSCGTHTSHLRGIKWLNNDLVNLGCAVAGALLGLMFTYLAR
jgi:uncharacterized protein (TIGR00297 family)